MTTEHNRIDGSRVGANGSEPSRRCRWAQWHKSAPDLRFWQLPRMVSLVAAHAVHGVTSQARPIVPNSPSVGPSRALHRDFRPCLRALRECEREKRAGIFAAVSRGRAVTHPSPHVRRGNGPELIGRRSRCRPATRQWVRGCRPFCSRVAREPHRRRIHGDCLVDAPDPRRVLRRIHGRRAHHSVTA